MSPVAYRRYLLIVLSLVLAFTYVDRLALGLVLENVKLALHLSDTQLGLLTGIAFAFFYSIMGVPIARWIDHGNRITVLWLAAAVWGLMVALSGRATNFLGLMLARSGVAVGEAAVAPAANSLIPDYFPRAERARAGGIYLMGGSLSLVIGFFAAGWLNQLFGWRTMFVILGLPGLVLAALVRSTLTEPRRESNTPRDASGMVAVTPADPADIQPVTTGCDCDQGRADHLTLWEACRSLWGIATFRHLLVGGSVTSFFSFGIGAWLPTYFVRSYGFDSGALGTWFTVVYGLPSVLGIYLGGEWASHWAAGKERLQLLAVVGLYLLFGIIWSFVFLAHTAYVAFALMAAGSVVINLTNAPLFSINQTLVPARMRGISVAGTSFLSNLIGMGLGPLAAGALSEALQRYFGHESLRYSLFVLNLCCLWQIWYVWQASRTVHRDLDAARTHMRSRGFDVDGHVTPFENR
jgi:MFS transporter, Spinster family, sphingosine-1-phosphate transporter